MMVAKNQWQRIIPNPLLTGLAANSLPSRQTLAFASSGRRRHVPTGAAIQAPAGTELTASAERQFTMSATQAGRAKAPKVGTKANS